MIKGIPFSGNTPISSIDKVLHILELEIVRYDPIIKNIYVRKSKGGTNHTRTKVPCRLIVEGCNFEHVCRTNLIALIKVFTILDVEIESAHHDDILTFVVMSHSSTNEYQLVLSNEPK